MVRLATVRSGFEAKVIAARLGSEGIVWELRGNADSMYPVGPVEVLVTEEDVDVARELLLVDEVESAFDADADTYAGHESRPGRGSVEFWMAVAVLVAVVGMTVARVVVAAS